MRKLNKICCLSIIISLLGAGLFLKNHMSSPPSILNQDLRARNSDTQVMEMPKVYDDHLLEINQNKKKVEAPLPLNNNQPSPLNINLKGIVIDKNALNSIAFIEDYTNQTERSYKIGNLIQGWTIDKILADKIILKRELIEQVVLLSQDEIDPKNQNLDLARDKTAWELLSSLSSTKKIQEETLNSMKKSIHINPNSEYTLDPEKLDQTIHTKPWELLQGAQLMPELQEGRLVGIKISSVNNNGLWESAGFQAGDIIHMINNNAPTNFKEIINLASNLKDQKTIEIMITRDGRFQKLTYHIEN